MEDPDQPNAYPLMMFRFEYPKMKPIEFDKFVSTTDAGSKAFLSQVSTARTELAQLIASKKPGPSANQVIKKVESLFPLIMALGQVLATPGTRLKKQIPFSWSSPVHHKDKTLFITIPVFHYEVLMMINLLAAAHGNRALEQIRNAEPDDFDEPAKKAVEHLRVAAGCYEYLAKKAIHKWSNPPPETPLECNVTIAAAHRNLCLSAGQAIVVKKALLHEMSLPVVSKLSIGGFRKAESAFKAVVAMKEAKVVHTNFKDFLHAHAIVHKSMALKTTGDALHSEEKYGECIGFLSAANTTIDKIAVPKDKSSPLYVYADDIKQCKSIIYHKKALYIQANDNIYGKRAMPEDEIDIPDGKDMVAPTPFSLPRPAFATI